MSRPTTAADDGRLAEMLAEEQVKKEFSPIVVWIWLNCVILSFARRRTCALVLPTCCNDRYHLAHAPATRLFFYSTSFFGLCCFSYSPFSSTHLHPPVRYFAIILLLIILPDHRPGKTKLQKFSPPSFYIYFLHCFLSPTDYMSLSPFLYVLPNQLFYR
jgi:hypothetical protein